MWGRSRDRNQNGGQEQLARAQSYLPEIDLQPQRPPAQPVPCTEHACQGTEGWPCAYRDRTGKECATTWCDRHVDFIGEMAFCRRHAGVMRVLASASDTLQGVKLAPSVEDRSLSLVSAVSQELEEPVMELLRRRFGNQGDVQVVADRAVRVLRPDPTRLAWERGWAALKPQGYAGRVAIRVPVGEDPQIRLVVNNAPVLQTIPDWIQTRLSGQAVNPDDHSNFKFRIMVAIEQAFDAAQTAVSGLF